MNNNKKTKKKRHNGEGSIRQKPNGRYEVRISGRDMETGKSTRISKYADTLDEAVDIQHALSVAMVQTPQYLQNNTTVGEWLDNWLTTYMQHTLKQSTYKSYETYVRKHFKPSLGTIKLKELTPRTLQIFYNYKQEQENLYPKTISNLNMCLHKALAQAQSEGLILSNPSGSVSLPPLIKPHIEVLTREQQARLMQASYQFRYGVFVRMTLVTGLRLGEVVGLRWCDIDFYTNMLHVNQTLNRLQRYDDDEADSKTEIVTQTPKSQNSIRSIPMLPDLVMDLQNWRTVQMQDAAALGTAYFDSGLIATQENGLYVEPRLMREYYQKMLATANLPNYNFHALRHPYVKHTTKIFSLRSMAFQAQAYPDARRKTRGACQLHRGGQSQSPVRPLCNRKRFSCLPPQSKISRILYAISIRLSGYTSTRSISSSASSVVSVSASKIALDASLRLSCRTCSSCFCFACANTAA